MNYHPEFAKLLNKYLDAEYRSQSWLAQRLKIQPSTVGRWVNKNKRPGSPETVIRIADILGIHDRTERQALLVAAGYGYLERIEETISATGASSANEGATTSRPPALSAKREGRGRGHSGAGDADRTGDVVAESSWAPPPALVIKVEPEVSVMRAGAAQVQAALFGMYLQAGDRVMTFKKAAVDIICQNGLLIRLVENRIWTVDCRSDASEAVELSPLLKVPWADAFQPTDGAFDTRPASRTPEMRRGRANVPSLLSPRNTLVADARPTFHWQPVEGASGYRLRVMMPVGKWWEAETSDSYLIYPNNVPALEPDYEHVVILSTLDHPDKADEAWLRMIDENRLAELEQAKLDLQALDISEAAKGYLLAQLYRQFELYSAAIGELEHLTKTPEDTEQANMPVSPDLWRQLGDLYTEIGLYMQAENRYQTVLDETSPDVEPKIRAQAYVGLARISVAFGDTLEAIEQLDEAETLYREGGDVERAELIAAQRRKLGGES